MLSPNTTEMGDRSKLLCNQPLRTTQPPTLSRIGNNCQGAVAALCSWEGNRRSGVALAMHHGLCGISTYVVYPPTGSMT